MKYCSVYVFEQIMCENSNSLLSSQPPSRCPLLTMFPSLSIPSPSRAAAVKKAPTKKVGRQTKNRKLSVRFLPTHPLKQPGNPNRFYLSSIFSPFPPAPSFRRPPSPRLPSPRPPRRLRRRPMPPPLRPPPPPPLPPRRRYFTCYYIFFFPFSSHYSAQPTSRLPPFLSSKSICREIIICSLSPRRP